MQSNKTFRNTKISKVQETENELKIILNMFEQEFHYGMIFLIQKYLFLDVRIQAKNLI